MPRDCTLLATAVAAMSIAAAAAERSAVGEEAEGPDCGSMVAEATVGGTREAEEGEAVDSGIAAVEAAGTERCRCVAVEQDGNRNLTSSAQLLSSHVHVDLP